MRSLLLVVLLALTACAHAASPPSLVRDGAIEARPRTLRARMTGSGRPVIFIQDLGAPAEVWDTTVAHLASRAEAACPRHRRVHREPSRGELALPELPAEIATYIRENRLDRPCIVGHMFG